MKMKKPLVEPVVYRSGLGAGAAVGLVNFDVFSSGFFVLGYKGGVVVFVKLPSHVIRGVEQGLGLDSGAKNQAHQAKA